MKFYYYVARTVASDFNLNGVDWREKALFIPAGNHDHSYCTLTYSRDMICMTTGFVYYLQPFSNNYASGYFRRDLVAARIPQTTVLGCIWMSY